jgi:hypothetical protein
MTVAARARRGLRIFTRSRPVVGERARGMMQPPVWDEASVKVLPEFFEAGGSATATLFVDPEGTDEQCLNLIWLRLASNYQLPRHTHTSDCLYYISSGEIRLGNRTLRAGDGFFVPSDAPYSYVAGPEGAEVLEFRGKADPINSHLKETPAGWRRILAGVRQNREHWVDELRPVSNWCRSADSIDYRTPEGEARSLPIKR